MPVSDTQGAFRSEDLLQIETTLYEPKVFIPSVRQIFSVNRDFDPGAEEYGYDWYQRTGDGAKKTARAANAQDVSYVGEKMGRVSFKPEFITKGYQYTRQERLNMALKQRIGKGPGFALDLKRIESVRRLIDEAENEIFFKGDADLSKKGLFNWTDGTHTITPTSVADGAAGSGAAKKLWANKTGAEIITDLITAKKAALGGGLYNPDSIMFSADSRMELEKPFAAGYDTTPVFNRVKELFQNVYIARECDLNFNGLGGVNCFVVWENTSDVIEIATLEELVLLQGNYDVVETWKQVAQLKTGGAIIRYHNAIKIYKGI